MRLFQKNSALNHIILINVLVFLILRLCFEFTYLNPRIVENILATPSNIEITLQKPWTLLTHMFTHINTDHILGNMVLLYIFGKIFLQYLNNTKLISTYLLGGLFSFFFLLLFDNSKDFNYGASGAIYAIMCATTAFVPNYSFKIYKTNVLIKIKYITITLLIMLNLNPIIISLFKSQMPDGVNIAHIGGGIYGLLYIYLLKAKINIGFMIEKFFEFISSLFRVKNKKVARIKNENDYDYNTRKKNEEQKLNKILEKVSKSGYSSLSKQEKEMLKKYN